MASSKPDVSQDVHGNSLPDNGSRRKRRRRHKAGSSQDIPRGQPLTTAIRASSGKNSLHFKHFPSLDRPERYSKDKPAVLTHMRVRRGINDLDLELLWLDARDDIKSVGCYALRGSCLSSQFLLQCEHGTATSGRTAEPRSCAVIFPRSTPIDYVSLRLHQMRVVCLQRPCTKTINHSMQNSRVPDTRQGVTGRKPANPVKIVGHTVHTTTARTPPETSAIEDVTPRRNPRDIPGTTESMPVFVQSIACVASPTIVGAVDFSTATADSRSLQKEIKRVNGLEHGRHSERSSHPAPSKPSPLMSGKRVHKDPCVQGSYQTTRTHRMSLDFSAAAVNSEDSAYHTHQEPIESANLKTPVLAIHPPASARYVSTNHYRLQTATHSNVNVTSRTTTIHAASAFSSPPHARPIDNAAVSPSTPAHTDTSKVDARLSPAAHALTTSDTIISRSRTGSIGKPDKSDDLRCFDVTRVSDHSVSNADDSVLPDNYTLHDGTDVNIHAGDFAIPDDQESKMDTGNLHPHRYTMGCCNRDAISGTTPLT